MQKLRFHFLLTLRLNNNKFFLYFRHEFFGTKKKTTNVEQVRNIPYYSDVLVYCLIEVCKDFLPAVALISKKKNVGVDKEISIMFPELQFESQIKPRNVMKVQKKHFCMSYYIQSTTIAITTT